MQFMGIDGCPAGWVALRAIGRELGAIVYVDWPALMTDAPRNAVIAVDIPIGLPRQGARNCDRAARALLGRPRGSSVFPAPVRACLPDDPYRTLCGRHQAADGRRLTRQAFHILPRIRQVDRWLAEHARDRARIFEVHPEVSFARWNRGHALRHYKRTAEGRLERRRLIEAVWPGERERLWATVRGGGCREDDLNDAFAALWTARRILSGTAVRLPRSIERDERGLTMQIRA